jgi:hypothetical protein
MDTLALREVPVTCLATRQEKEESEMGQEMTIRWALPVPAPMPRRHRMTPGRASPPGCSVHRLEGT